MLELGAQATRLGVALLDMGRPMDAAVQLAEAVNRAPGYARGRGNLARALFALEKPEEACNQLRIALDQDPLLAGLEAERKTCGLISKLE